MKIGAMKAENGERNPEGLTDRMGGKTENGELENEVEMEVANEQ